MANKQKKKRNKQYSGADASLARPVVTKIAAADRGRFQQWWFEKKRIARPIIIAVLVLIAVVWLLIELIRALT